MSPKIAVIAGAGPAGLTAAWELLTRTDVVPVVCEMSREMGGMARTVSHHGNRMDVGGHRFFTRQERVLDWWKHFLPVAGGEGRPGPDPKATDRVMLVRDRRSSIFFDNRFFPYPLTLDPATLKSLGARRLARIGLSYGKSRLFPVPEKNLEDFFVNRFGRSLYEMFFMDYTRKVWGADAADILPQWGQERVRGLSVSAVAAHAFRRLAGADRSLSQAGTQVSLVERFLYPKFGPGQLWEEVAADIRRMGGTILTEHKVQEVRLEGGRVKSIRAASPGGFVDLDADYFFSTMPVRHMIRALDPGAPMTVRRAAEGLTHRNFLAVGLLADPKRTSPRPQADAAKLS
ncbi:MAG: NAD(P)-binding protein, partial [Proteobacteria bacterium]|nr:NAD(P)-binding protein [Pseudomonadota bacterium]